MGSSNSSVERMFVALIASAAAFVPVPPPTRYGAAVPVAPAVQAPGGFYAVSAYPQTPVYVVPAVQRPRSSGSWISNLALHAAVTGALATSVASLGLLGSSRSATAHAQCTGDGRD